MQAPVVFKAAQNLLLATKHFIKRDGWFTSHKKRHDRMLGAYTMFINAFMAKSLYPEEIAAHGTRHAAILYLDQMSSVFPDWQDEYAFLDQFVWEPASLEVTEDDMLSSEEEV